MFDMLNIFQGQENTYRKVSATGGGEYHGACPYCGGRDRFSIFPARDHFVCRVCSKAGDTIFFLMDHHRLTYKQACERLGIDSNRRFRPSLLSGQAASWAWTPRMIEPQTERWSEQASIIVEKSKVDIFSGFGKKALAHLQSRGLSLDIIKMAGIGLNRRPVTFSADTWGLPLVHVKDAEQSDIWLPRGVLIPQYENSRVVRIRIRQDKPVSNSRGRYIIARGSRTGYFIHTDRLPEGFPAVLVESELDGWLMHQIIGDVANVLSIGNANSRPDWKTFQFLKKSSRIITILDNDPAGIKEHGWWAKNFKNCDNWLMPAGKDPSEAVFFGIDIRGWFLGKIGASGSGVVIENFSEKMGRSPLTSSHPSPSPPVTAQPSPPVPAQETKRSDIECLHGQVCIFKEKWICLKTKLPIFSMKECPKELWYTYKDSNNVSSVVLGVKYKTKR